MAGSPLLTAEQKQILDTITEEWALGLAADIAHATVTCFLPTTDKRELLIYRQMRPRTQVVKVQPDLSGRSVRCLEEPLVTRCLRQNLSFRGNREWALGAFTHYSVYPLQDRRGRCFAALGFEGAEEDEVFTQQVLAFLQSLCVYKQQGSGTELFGRMQPGDGLLLVDPDKQIIAANNRARHLFQVLGIKDVIGRRTNDVAINWPLVGMVMATGQAESKEFTAHGLLLRMRVLPVTAAADGGCAVVILQDVTELRQKEEELRLQSMVIKEIHHRVKNNLQTVASILRLQARRARSEEARLVLRDCMRRVDSIAIVHEYLSQQDSGRIDVSKVLKGIYTAVAESMAVPSLQLTTEFYADTAYVSSRQATSIALILNELVQNALEHGFKGRSKGRLQIAFREESERYRLSVLDDGAGLPKDFSFEHGNSLGLKIIKTMAEADLGGSFALERREQGTGALVLIPKENGGERDGK